MTQTQHTAGPWMHAQCSKRLDGRDDFIIANGREHVCFVKKEANARLIAAAPDLLAALQNLADAIDAGELVITFTGQTHGQPSKLNRAGDVANIDNARAALAQARP